VSDKDKYQIELSDEVSQLTFGARLARIFTPGMVVFLRGDLGVGKTTLCRGIINGMGFEGNVKSPTYTLVEPYELADRRVYHFDLYRLGEPTELEYMGCRDYFDEHSICLVEWPERGDGVLPAPDLALDVEVRGRGRRVTCLPYSDQGRRLVNLLHEPSGNLCLSGGGG
jgi:tRNA threonylcarbamoyladenosine biosynthesis protein TsaE